MPLKPNPSAIKYDTHGTINITVFSICNLSYGKNDSELGSIDLYLRI